MTWEIGVGQSMSEPTTSKSNNLVNLPGRLTLFVPEARCPLANVLTICQLSFCRWGHLL